MALCQTNLPLLNIIKIKCINILFWKVQKKLKSIIKKKRQIYKILTLLKFHCTLQKWEKRINTDVISLPYIQENLTPMEEGQEKTITNGEWLMVGQINTVFATW